MAFFFSLSINSEMSNWKLIHFSNIPSLTDEIHVRINKQFLRECLKEAHFKAMAYPPYPIHKPMHIYYT